VFSTSEFGIFDFGLGFRVFGIHGLEFRIYDLLAYDLRLNV